MAKKKKKATASNDMVKPAYLAEMVGTFTLTLLAFMSNVLELTILIPALTLGVIVYALGKVSGAHVNPAVTLGLYSVRKMSSNDTMFYIIYQVIGAVLAMLLGQYLAGGSLALQVDNTMAVGVAEMIGAAILLFGVTAVVYGNVSDAASGFTIGGSLLIGSVVASAMSYGILNPAVALGLGVVSPVYVVGPVVGGIVGAWVYKTVLMK